MFTGLVQDVGTVERVLPGPMTTLWIRTALGASEFAPGESIAVSGACLTVVERDADRFRVDAAPETLRRTTLGELRSGSRVNLE
ncbi:MAG TPA: riboflavin synthase, partial [Myxococcaceae bacterium]